MLHLDNNIKVCAFEDFKRVVKGTLGQQMFTSKDYYIRQAVSKENNLFVVRFSRTVDMPISALKRAWTYIYKDCLTYGIGDSHYVEGFIPEPCIHNKTLIFTIDFIK